MADLDAAEELAYSVIGVMRDLEVMDLAKGAEELAHTLRAALTLAQQEARAERDREWREALERARPCGARVLPDKIYGVCQDCARLRALLEGK